MYKLKFTIKLKYIAHHKYIHVYESGKYKDTVEKQPSLYEESCLEPQFNALTISIIKK